MLLEVARYGKEAMPDLSLQRLNDPMDVREKFEVLFPEAVLNRPWFHYPVDE
jgi:hypothetical protein